MAFIMLLRLGRISEIFEFFCKGLRLKRHRVYRGDCQER